MALKLRSSKQNRSDDRGVHFLPVRREFQLADKLPQQKYMPKLMLIYVPCHSVISEF